MSHLLLVLAALRIASALLAPPQTSVGAEPSEVEALVRRALAPDAAEERVRWVTHASPAQGALDVALLALEEGLGDRAARARFEVALSTALARIGPGGRIAVAPRELAPSSVDREALYLDFGRVARRLGERGLSFEQELPLRACGGRRSAAIFVRGAQRVPLDVERLPALSPSFGGRRVALLAEEPSRAAAASALHRRGLADGVEDWRLEERWAPDEAPAELPAPRFTALRFRSGNGGARAAEGRLHAVLVIDALHGALDRRALLDEIHAALTAEGLLWVLERTDAERRTALEHGARQSLEPRELFREIAAAGFAVRALEERDGALNIYAARASRAHARARESERGVEPWAERLRGLGLAEPSSAHLVGAHPLLGAAELRALGLSAASSDPWGGPAEPVELLLVASWSRHPAPALFLDRPEAYLRAGGWLAVVHDAAAVTAPPYADPDAIVGQQPELRFEAELPGAALGRPDLALWLFRRP
jgi:hypothetical protein